MGTTLATLSPPKGAVRARKRVGRGVGSGSGRTASRGVKGQKSRSGSHYVGAGFEGGQMPLQRRLPKRGFKNPFRTEYAAVNVGAIGKAFADNETMIGVDQLRAAGLCPRSARRVKVLGDGELTRRLTIEAHAFSRSARDKIAAAGGSANVVLSERSASTGSAGSVRAKD